MGRIRSAWEIALERTENIEVDEKKLRQASRVDEVRKIAGSFLSSEERDTAKLEKLHGYEDEVLREGLRIALMGSVTLSQNKADGERNERLMLLAAFVFRDEESYSLYGKLIQLCAQYPEHREQLIDQLEKSLEPELRQKEAMMKEQYGEEVHLSIEEDKEMMEIVKQNLEKLSRQYEELIRGAKEKLEAVFAK